MVEEYTRGPTPSGSVQRYTFVTFHQSYGYEEFVEGLRPVLQGEGEGSDVQYEIRAGAFKKLCDRARLSKDQHFAMVIDEINRGNISKIFGELITLIEVDKREGAENAAAVALSYSGEAFSVPNNVDIIGTMNTADRSVEALDTALRRRFTFEEIPPDYDLDQLQYEFEEIAAADILKTINTRIEKLTNKDHAIGHSYFFLKENEMPEEKLPTVFYKNIIPLLQEYFYGDFSKIGLVLGKGFVRKKSWSLAEAAFADFDSESATDFNDREIFEIIDYTKPGSYTIRIGNADVELDFNKAIKLLMRQPIE